MNRSKTVSTRFPQMKALSLIVFCLTIAPVFNTVSAAPTQVMILGTYHFASNNDIIKFDKEDMLKPERQAQIEAVTERLAQFKPDRIFVEWDPVSDQSFVDSIYQEYLAGRYQLGRNEIYQLGFRMARKLGHETLYCTDASGYFLKDTLVSTAGQFGKGERFRAFEDSMKRIAHAQDSTLKVLTMSQGLAMMNSTEAMQFGLAINFIFLAPELGPVGNYAGAEFVGEWYKRNIRMYSNLIRQTRDSDQRVLLIVGASHKPILQHFFETNPRWQVVDVIDYLQ